LEEIQVILSRFPRLGHLRLSTFSHLWRAGVADDVNSVDNTDDVGAADLQRSTDPDFDAAVLLMVTLNIHKVGAPFQNITVRAYCPDPTNQDGGWIWRVFEMVRHTDGSLEVVGQGRFRERVPPAGAFAELSRTADFVHALSRITFP
jgi:hypothetical protein